MKYFEIKDKTLRNVDFPLKRFLKQFIFMYGAHIPAHTGRSETAFTNWFSPSIMRILGTELTRLGSECPYLHNHLDVPQMNSQ